MLSNALGLVLALVTWAVTLADVGPEFVTIARCRVNCLQQFVKDEKSGKDNVCISDSQCNLCWDSCQLLFLDYQVWGPRICVSKKRCTLGCETACKYRKAVPEGGATSVQWKFPHLAIVIADPFKFMDSIEITWPEPETAHPIGRKTQLVYILFARDGSDHSSKEWEEITQTASTIVELDRNDLPEYPEFWLLAVNSNGSVADIKFTSSDFPFGPDIVGVPENVNAGLKDVEWLNSPLNISIKLQTTDGTTNAALQWSHPPPYISGEYEYDIHWFFQNCEVYLEAPDCNIPAKHRAGMIIADRTETPSYQIPDLIFNAEYLVRVELRGQADKWYAEAVFFTPFCLDLDSFTHCATIPGNQKELTTKHTTGSPSGKASSWELNVTAMMYNPHSHQVVAFLAWTAPFNQSAEHYRIMWEAIDQTEYLDMGNVETNSTHIRLQLKPNNHYKVHAKALYVTFNGDFTSVASDMLEVNTSEVNLMAVVPEPHTAVVDKADDYRTLNGVIVGVTCIGSVIILGVIVLFIYKKRQSFKDIIITKTTVAKSNSYKSNVGCKTDYSNQLLVLSDEWELDPRYVKFSSPIGQGAFGKVVTGFYFDRKVAIKLVRDSAPLSYKEDLLAEINLMKRIGTHPNIVGMIGACTLVEPIALVMEYVPYGNLQNFLKKCRMEGEMRKRQSGHNEITYSMVDDRGAIDNGVITPTDMLSCARQVAMAMEYLAEKKYVHRDLAARNILLDYGKVVKVCDFGLSRDIYNDNQYQKLTNGKLPLKWMAIESLRDRVFTIQSDVWSFGILLWEIVTMGASPYPNIALADLYYVLANGYRMERPSNCSEELYTIMRQCWFENPTDRPDFTQIRLQLEDLLTRDRDYLDLENIDVPLTTSENSSNPASDDTSSPHALAAKGLQACSRPGKEELTVNVCIHEKSTERLIYRRGDDSPVTSS